MRVLVGRHEKDWNFWQWLFWGLFIYSALEACAFFVAWIVLKRTAGELWAPYVAFIVPGVVMISLVWWLRSWRERGAPLKALARGWGMSMGLFALACLGALAYSGIKLHLVDPAGAAVRFIITTLIVFCISCFTGYRTALSLGGNQERFSGLGKEFKAGRLPERMFRREIIASEPHSTGPSIRRAWAYLPRSLQVVLLLVCIAVLVLTLVFVKR